MKTLIKPNFNQRCVDALDGFIDMLPYMLLMIMGVMFVCGHAFADDTGGTDYLSGGTSDVTKTFGQNSALLYFIYIAEAVVVAFTWVKTKSPWALVSLPVLLVATHVFFGTIHAPTT